MASSASIRFTCVIHRWHADGWAKGKDNDWFVRILRDIVIFPEIMPCVCVLSPLLTSHSEGEL